MRALLALVAALLITLPVTAGPGNGTDLTATSNVLYIHSTDDNPESWMSNTKEESGSHYDGVGMGSPAIAPPTLGWFTFNFPMAPAPMSAIALDPAAGVDATVTIGGWSPEAVGYVGVWWYLYVDGTEVAAGELQENAFAAGAETFTWEGVALSIDEIPAGAEVEWTIEFDGAMSYAYIMMSDDYGWTSLTLPAVGTGATTTTSSTTTSAPPTPTTTTSTTTAPPSSSSTSTTSALPTTSSTTTTSPSEPIQAIETGEEESQGAPGVPLLFAGLGLALLASIRRRL